MKKLLVLLIFFCSFSGYAFAVNDAGTVPAPLTCPMAAPVSSGNFCASFKVAATCRCAAKGLPPAICGNIHKLYDYVIAFYHGSQDTMCSDQKDTSKQDCMDDWDCYMKGGDHGGLCNGTGLACE